MAEARYLNLLGVRDFMTVIEPSRTPVHESVTRAYQILELTKTLLREDVPGNIVLGIVAELEAQEPSRFLAKSLNEAVKTDKR